MDTDEECLSQESVLSWTQAASWQPQSRLIQLPQEIRDEIYNHLIDLTHALPETGTWPAYVPNPASRGLFSLLRTCQRVHDEIGDSWVSRIQLNYSGAEKMLDNLLDMDWQTRCRIRYILLFNDLGVYVRTKKPHQLFQCELWQTFALMTGLQLDCLTIIGEGVLGDGVFANMEQMVYHGDGWKELRLYTLNSFQLNSGFKIFSKRIAPLHEAEWAYKHHQTFGWQQILNERDGSGSAPSIEIFRNKVENEPRAIFGCDGREAHVNPYTADQSIMSQLNLERDVTAGNNKSALVVVKRGADVDYAVPDVAPDCSECRCRRGYHDNIVLLLGDTPWKEFTAEQKVFRERDFDLEPDFVPNQASELGA